MNKPIYLDYAATTPADPRVVESMMQCMTLDGNFGNPASRSHRFGWQAEESVEVAREQVANLFNVDPREIVFTSGATESNNLAIKGAAQYYREKGNHIITMTTEHKAVLDTCAFLETQGFEVTYLKPLRNGRLDFEALKAAIKSETILVTIMHVNNETGVIQDLQRIGELLHARDILFHVDAAQGTGKIAIDLNVLPVDLMSCSAGKIYGPKGIGALYVQRRPRIHLVEQINGGGHERGMRSGTLPTHQIVGMGKALEIAKQEMEAEQKKLWQLRHQFLDAVLAMPGVILNGDPQNTVPGIINLSFEDVDGESLLMALKDIAVSTGSACTSASLEPSYVLTQMGLEPELAHSSIRFSFGRFTTEDQVKIAVDSLAFALPRLRQVS